MDLWHIPPSSRCSKLISVSFLQAIKIINKQTTKSEWEGFISAVCLGVGHTSSLVLASAAI